MKSVLTEDQGRPRRNLDVSEVGSQLGLSVATLYRWHSDGTDMPKPYKVGGRLRWTQESVDAFIDAQIAKAV
jgi:predicted DNA-binding transcriptional regulator AlpA